MKVKLAATEMFDFTGDDIELHCDNQLVILQLLDNAGFLQLQYLSCLSRPLTWWTSPEFQLHFLNQNKAVSEYLFKTQLMEFSLISEADRLDFEEKIHSAWYDNNKLVDADDWNPGPWSTTPDF